uniref:Uncharacterized protein n=1 Tax=Cyclophora tenuis TaxID=216820 RepID=A0A7S1DBE6_CYCTE|mmetsp:Transcript_643/g.1116  ORF Transcript_643/g.1116 Transcript_643/m.1116 type:complete len:182 (+) Transcript_643:124-669(+)
MPPLQQDDYTDNNDDSAHSTFLKTTEVSSSLLLGEERKTKISFGTVGVRTFNRIVGDHPDCKVGPPLTLDWQYMEHEPIDLDQYETSHAEQRRKNLRLTSITRKNLLRNIFEVPEKEILAAEKEVQKILKQRSQTKRQGKTSEKAELFTQSARRKLQRVFSKERIWKGVLDSSSQMFPVTA